MIAYASRLHYCGKPLTLSWLAALRGAAIDIGGDYNPDADRSSAPGQVTYYQYDSGMASVIIAYSTVDGHTQHICERIARLISDKGHDVELAPIDDGPAVDLAAFDKIVIGASIRYGKHRPQVTDLINRNQGILENTPSAFFSVNVVARKPEKSTPDTNPYLQKYLRQIDWQPKNLAVFAGKIDYPRYTSWDRLIIRLIMWMTRGPTDPTAVVEFTDWDKVDEFANLIAEM